MQWYTCKSLLNTLGRAVEQLAGALPLSSTQASKSQHSRSKFKSHALPARKVMNIEYYQLSCLESRFTTTPKTARCCRKRVMDIPARPEVSCLSLTIHIIKEFTTITMHRESGESLAPRAESIKLMWRVMACGSVLKAVSSNFFYMYEVGILVIHFHNFSRQRSAVVKSPNGNLRINFRYASSTQN